MAKSSGIAPLLLLAGAGAGVWYLNKTGKLSTLFTNQEKVSEANLKLRLAGFHAETDGTVMADIEALNPASRNLAIKSVVGNFLVNGKNAGAVKMFGDQVIRANDQGTIPVSVKIMPAAAAMWRKKGSRVQFRGEININDHVAPLTMDYTL